MIISRLKTVVYRIVCRKLRRRRPDESAVTVRPTCIMPDQACGKRERRGCGHTRETTNHRRCCGCCCCCGLQNADALQSNVHHRRSSQSSVADGVARKSIRPEDSIPVSTEWSVRTTGDGPYRRLYAFIRRYAPACRDISVNGHKNHVTAQKLGKTNCRTHMFPIVGFVLIVHQET